MNCGGGRGQKWIWMWMEGNTWTRYAIWYFREVNMASQEEPGLQDCRQGSYVTVDNYMIEPLNLAANLQEIHRTENVLNST